MVTEIVPELLNYKEKTQLILGLRARVSECDHEDYLDGFCLVGLILKFDLVDLNAIEDHLNSFQERTTNSLHEEVGIVQSVWLSARERDNFLVLIT